MFLAALGLVLSSFALLVLQSTMGGLQRNLISRSKKIVGSEVLFLDKLSLTEKNAIKKRLTDKKINFWPELELEILVKNRGFLSPVVVHGVEKDRLPDFLDDKDLNGIVLGGDLSYKIKTGYEDTVLVISPAHFDPLLGNVPRHSQIDVLDIISTNVPEIDLFHAWTRISFLQNLIKKRDFNLFRIADFKSRSEKSIYTDLKHSLMADFPDLRIKTWEQLHPTLTKALNLETSVMIFLFISMTFLVSIAITSGVLIFMEKVNKDIISMWILGSSPTSLKNSTRYFFFTLNFLCIVLGLVLGFAFLYFIKEYGQNIMPDVFIDRNIPVHITVKGVLVSGLGPLVISSFFSFFAFAQFKTDSQTFLEKIRTAG